MIDPHNIALITCIDTNKKIIGEKNTFEYRLFEYEAINCYTHWRKNAGWLKDINIYSLNSKGHIISKQCINKLQKLNITYIEKYNDFICKNNIDFIDKLYAQSFFEHNNNIKEQYLIYVDLDVALINKFPNFIFNQVEQGKIILAKHDIINKNICSPDFLNRYINIHDKLNGNCYNAYLVIEDKKQYFFNTNLTKFSLIFTPIFLRKFSLCNLLFTLYITMKKIIFLRLGYLECIL